MKKTITRYCLLSLLCFFTHQVSAALPRIAKTLRLKAVTISPSYRPLRSSHNGPQKPSEQKSSSSQDKGSQSQEDPSFGAGATGNSIVVAASVITGYYLQIWYYEEEKKAHRRRLERNR